MLSILSQFSGSLNARHVTTSESLADGQRDELLAGEDLGYDLPLDLFTGEVDNLRD